MSIWFSRIGHCVDAGRTLEHDHTVSQVGGHDEVVLHHKRRLLGMQDEPGIAVQIILRLFTQGV